MGHGQIKLIEAKFEAISDFLVPTCKKQLMRFFGMAGYYRKFCNNFSVIAEPLIDLLSKRMRFKWTSDCQNAFEIWDTGILKFNKFSMQQVNKEQQCDSKSYTEEWASSLGTKF